MDQTKFLILGANGQLGTALRERYPGAQIADKTEINISDSESVQKYNWSNISHILNAAAYTNVDGAESSDGRIAAWQANSQSISYLAKVAIEHDITLIHISSDYVFDGSQLIHVEYEPLSPLSVYGQTKAAGDLIASMTPKHYILRTSWVIGEGRNFVRIMLDLGQKGVSPTVVSDQIGRLTFTHTLVNAIDHLISTNAAYGVYNVSNDGTETTWAAIARIIFEVTDQPVSVTDISTDEYFKNKPQAAPRPLHSTLDLSKLKATGFKPHNWQDDLREYLKKESRT
ncbi:MAG: hypothetical protein NVSMB37_4470 [Candidatus Saccharimonadales bacterium]